MGFIGFSVWSTYQVLFFVALAIIFIMCIIIGIQSAKTAERKQDIQMKPPTVKIEPGTILYVWNQILYQKVKKLRQPNQIAQPNLYHHKRLPPEVIPQMIARNIRQQAHKIQIASMTCINHGINSPKSAGAEPEIPKKSHKV